MSSKTKVSLIILIVVVLSIIITDSKSDSFSIIKKDYKDYNGGNTFINYTIYKTDEDNNFLKGVGFKISSFNNVINDSLTENSNNYSIGTDYDISLERFYNVLSSEQLSLIRKINSTDDLKDYYNRNNLYCYNPLDPVTSGPQSIVGNSGTKPTCSLTLPTVFILEENSVPVGYSKDKFILPGTINIVYEIEDSSIDFNNSVPVKLVNYMLESNSNNGEYFKYGEINLNYLVGTDIEVANNIWNNQAYFNSSCQELSYPKTNNLNIYNSLECPIKIENKKGSANITIESKVNNEEEIIAIKGSKLKYQIAINNTGNAPAIDNIITTTIPKGIIYVDGSVSNNGIYESGKITWNIERLKANDSIILSYEAIVPENSSITSFIGETTLDSFSLNKRINSNKTQVKIHNSNPKTSNQLMLIELVISLILGLNISLYLYLRRKHTPKFKF